MQCDVIKSGWRCEEVEPPQQMPEKVASLSGFPGLPRETQPEFKPVEL